MWALVVMCPATRADEPPPFAEPRDESAQYDVVTIAAGLDNPAGLALHIQGVLQGAFILAKTTGDARVAADSLGHLRRYLTLLFEPQPQREALS